VGYVIVTLMNFDKQSNARRTTVESKPNRSCNNAVQPTIYLPCVPKKTVVPNFGDNFVKS